MSGIRNPQVITGVPVITAPAEIDISAARQLRTVLLDSAARGHPAMVVDMTGTRFCDSIAFGALFLAHRRARDQGRELRLVLPPGGAAVRAFRQLGLDCLIPWFTSLEQALTAGSRHGNPPRPSSPAELRLPQPPGIRGSRV